jgi:hypothetical protein
MVWYIYCYDSFECCEIGARFRQDFCQVSKFTGVANKINVLTDNLRRVIKYAIVCSINAPVLDSGVLGAAVSGLDSWSTPWTRLGHHQLYTL